MSASSRILRGEAMAVQLQRSLPDTSPGTATWMDTATRLLKSDVYNRVGLLRIDGGLYYLKFYACKSSWRRYLYQLGRGRALRAYDTGARMAALGLPVPRPLACLQVADGVLLLAEYIVDAPDLQTLWQQCGDNEQRLALLDEAGSLLGRLHQAGFSHGDCKWPNWLVSGDQLWLVDLDAACISPRAGARQWRDLARFTLNAEELEVADGLYGNFLASYCQVVEREPEVVLRRIRPRLLKLRARHLARYGKRGRPLL